MIRIILYTTEGEEFTIQNFSIKCIIFDLLDDKELNLQYKMFLLNLIFLKLPI